MNKKHNERDTLVSLSLAKHISHKEITHIVSQDFNTSILDEGQVKELKLILSKIKVFHDQLEDKNIQLVTLLDFDYPQEFRDLHMQPFVFYAKGNLELLKTRKVSVVGTRKSTSYGLSICKKLVPSLCNSGFTTVSGLAFGTDACIHEYTLDVNGKTVAVLASSVDKPSPASNTPLYKSILQKEGLVISEKSPFETNIQKYEFIQRNRLIAALGLFTIIPEAGENSGASTTAKFAFELGKNVYAFPGNVGQQSSFGTNKLIRDNVAQCCISTTDIFEVDENPTIGDINREGLSNIENILLDLIHSGVNDVGNVNRELDFSPGDISSALTSLEIKGILALAGSEISLVQ